MWSNIRFVRNGFAIRLMVVIYLFFFVPGSCLFMLISNFSFAFHLFFVSNSGFVLRLLLVCSVFLGFVSHFNVKQFLLQQRKLKTPQLYRVTVCSVYRCAESKLTLSCNDSVSL